MAPLTPEERRLPALLERGARLWPQRGLIRWAAGERTFAESVELAARAAGRLTTAGVGAGDRVAVVTGNRIELLEAWLGCGWIGAIAVPVNPAVADPALTRALEVTDPRVVLCEASLIVRLDSLPSRPPALERIWVAGDPDGIEVERSAVAIGGSAVPVEPVPGLGPAVEPAPVRPGDTWAILHTSGTTGVPKGVICPHAQFYWWGEIAGRRIGIREGDVLHTTMPMFHGNALNAFVQALVRGATYSFGQGFRAAGFWGEVRELGATVGFLRAAWIGELLDLPAQPGERDHPLRVALAPNTPAAPAEAFSERFGVTLIEGYGSTETNMVTCNRRGGEVRAGTLGWPNREFEVAVIDDEDQEVPDGAAGELVVRAREPYVLAGGYYKMPERTAESRRNLWFHTGDRVVRDADGCLRFLDRAEDAIRRAGESISSLEVERVLGMHPAVRGCAVVGVPAGGGEDEIMAFVVPVDGASPAPEELVEHCRERLAEVAVPRYVELIEALPQTQTRKVRKAVLRERGPGERTWDREPREVSP